MKLPIMGLAMIVVTTHSAHLARADWEAPIPGSAIADQVASSKPTQFGVALFGRAFGTRLVWISREGKIRIDYTASKTIQIQEPFILNDSQILIYCYDSEGGIDRILLSTTASGEFTSTAYSRLEGETFTFPGSAPEDTTGFYAYSSKKNSLRRVDFPSPSVGGALRIAIQTSPTPAGPWSALGDSIIPTAKPQEFFRLKATAP